MCMNACAFTVGVCACSEGTIMCKCSSHVMQIKKKDKNRNLHQQNDAHTELGTKRVVMEGVNNENQHKLSRPSSLCVFLVVG